MNIDEREKRDGKKDEEKMRLQNGDPTPLNCTKLNSILALGAFFCIIIPFVKNFQQATQTHCKVSFFAFECLHFRSLFDFVGIIFLTHIFFVKKILFCC